MPTTPYDAKGLIIAAARDDNPVIVVLNKMSLAITGEVPEETYEIPLGEANVLRPGDNLTIVALGRMTHEALKAVDGALRRFRRRDRRADPGRGLRLARRAGGPGGRAVFARAVLTGAGSALRTECGAHRG